MLTQLGLARGNKPERMPVAPRKRERNPEDATLRRASPRLAAASPRRPLAGNDGTFSTPPPVLAMSKPRRAPTARPALLSEAGSARWLVDMEAFLHDADAYLRFWSSMPSKQNVRAVMRQLTTMASGVGIEHPWQKGAPSFMAGEPLTLDRDAGELLTAASAWLATHGEDTSHGWLLTHPLKKLQAFQLFLCDGHRNLGAHLE
ncbi:hypothetical protein KFE25_002099 [Diacronema lutheri]|uniref:Uncharacterized protein n=1 Tax=Diacronema lutheri TaxID=2081491 RepID=A0A8J6CG51_DIALT|nr:hypothetical protein KFE25_002099 [Diacronema lutheri]